jgi:UDP-3-O-[3-hydroxymyristoyl] glucosamine N-acyltransferase
MITGISSLDAATKGQISFITGRKYLPQLTTCHASAIILSADLATNYNGANTLINHHPYLAYAKVVAAFHPKKNIKAQIHPSSIIDPSASIAAHVSIGARVVIGKDVRIAQGVTIAAGSVINQHCSIGSHTYLHANVTLYENTHIGQNTRLHSGVVIGSDGFGYAPDQGEWYKIKQVGNVIIGNAVEIGANTTIDCAALGSTVIEDGVKLDNLIQIGHNVHIGEHTAIAACVAIAGSATIGKRCQIGGASAIAGHLTLADDVIITGMSMVISSIPSAGVYSSGMPVNENRKWRKNIIRFTQLDKMVQKIYQLEKRIKKLP